LARPTDNAIVAAEGTMQTEPSAPNSDPITTALFLPLIFRQPDIVRSVDVAAYQAVRGGTWFSEALSTLPESPLQPTMSFDIKEAVLANRRSGRISPGLLSGYFFMQWDISSSALAPYAPTIQSLFLKSALMRFVDYPHNRVLGWDNHSTNIAADERGIIRVCNEQSLPVFLELNYSNYIPGNLGTGVESLQAADNIANTIIFLRALRDEGLRLSGVTFGDEIEDESGFGSLKPTIYNSDLITTYISYARAIKSEFPDLKIYAFGSYISATRGRVNIYLDFLNQVRQAELQGGTVLIDGFMFNESYVYMDENGNVRESQLILDDTESLYRDSPIYRYDVWGNTHPISDTAYLSTITSGTNTIFGRTIDIGITEYLPAVPVQMGETNTSQYADMDFILHFSDIVGTYAELGLDFVSKIMFGDHVDQHKAYFDRQGNRGVNYPVHEQLARYFRGDILQVSRSVAYDDSKIKVYAARQDANRYFLMVLNKDVQHEATMRITLTSHLDITVRVPRRSYTSILVDGASVTISSIGN
jgi:hypothetical protein